MAELDGADLTRLFAGGAGVRGVDLRVESGTVHALVGLNGAGKTTLMRLLLGMLRPDSGTVRLGGTLLDDLRPSDWGQVGHLVGHPLAYPELTVRTTLTLAARLHGVSRRLVGSRVDDILAELELARYADRRVRVLSQGTSSGSGWPSPCSTHRRWSSSTSPPTGWTPREWSSCARPCRGEWPRAPRCSCRATTSTRSPGSPTRSPS